MYPRKRDGRASTSPATPEPERLHHRQPDGNAVNQNALHAFNAAAAHRSAAVRCLASAVRHTAYAARCAGADETEVAQAVTAVRRDLVHALAGAIAAELGGAA